MKNFRIFGILVLAFILILPFGGQAQSSFQWVTSEAREINFPTETYIWGFVPGNLRNGETEADLLARLKLDAKTEAAGRVRTMVEDVAQKDDKQFVINDDYHYSSVYQDYTKQTVEAEIAGLKLETYYDASEKIGYAFAYVKKSELADYYKSQINIHLNKVQTTMANAKAEAESGKKVRARKTCENAMQPLSQAEFAQNLLSAVNPDDIASLQLDRFAQIKNDLQQAIIDLEQSTYIYLISSENNFGQTENILAPELKGILSNNQCSFTDDETQADFKITVNAKTRRHEGNVNSSQNFKFSYADADVEVYSNYKEKVVYSSKLTQKNTQDGSSYEAAGRNALKLSASKIWDNIKPWIIGK